MKRYGVFGGSFDPPHRAHHNCLQTLAKTEAFDRIFVIPSHFPPGKTPIADFSQRLEWAKKCFSAPPFVVLDWEAEAQHTVYAEELVHRLQHDHPEAELIWILGEDQLERLNYWKAIDSYASTIQWLVLPRSPHRDHRPAGLCSRRLMQSSCAYRWAQTDQVLEVSSRTIRTQIEGGDPEVKKWLPDVIAESAIAYYQKRTHKGGPR